MSEKPASEEFAEEPEEIAGDLDLEVETDVDLDKAIRALDVGKQRGQKAADPAWRKLERMREERATREMIKDFEDYDVGPDATGLRPRPPRHA
jgi:hypothetical protein